MEQLFRSPLGALLAQPWVDPVGLFGLRRWFFPLSRLWAAADAAGRDVQQFREAVAPVAAGAWPEAWLQRLLDRQAAQRADSDAHRRLWEAALFGGDGTADSALLDRQRRAAATRHQSMRMAFYPLLFPRRPPAALWRIDPPVRVLETLAAALADPESLYAAAPDIATVEASPAVARGDRRESWLRAATPATRLQERAGSERLYARVVEPADGGAAATLILGSGLGLEFDVLALPRDPAAGLVARGWRVVEPVSPYHGLRRMPGFYGGEPFYALGPTAAVDLVHGQALETALLIAWCRHRFGGPVAVAGISMSSFVVQQIASRCRSWPADARPDAAMMISHSGHVEDVTLAGALSAALGVDRAMVRAGWSRPSLQRLAPLIDPASAPALPPDRIVSVLGEADRWVPYRDGLALAERWKLPAANVFRYPLGHLGMPVQLARDAAPFERLRQVLDG